MPRLISDDSWTLDESIAGDVDRLMAWLPDADSIDLWGGPEFRFPYTRRSFEEDMHWGKMASFSLRDPSGSLAAFGQIYEKFGCINLARLVANPEMRCRGVGKRLVGMLMTVSRPMFSCTGFSLFVYPDNTPAYECYKSMGFTIDDCPGETALDGIADYITCPVTDLEN